MLAGTNYKIANSLAEEYLSMDESWENKNFRTCRKCAKEGNGKSNELGLCSQYFSTSPRAPFEEKCIICDHDKIFHEFQNATNNTSSSFDRMDSGASSVGFAREVVVATTGAFKSNGVRGFLQKDLSVGELSTSRALLDSAKSTMFTSSSEGDSSSSESKKRTFNDLRPAFLNGAGIYGRSETKRADASAFSTPKQKVNSSCMMIKAFLVLPHNVIDESKLKQGSLHASSVLVKYAKAHGLFLEIATTKLSGIKLDQVVEYARGEVLRNDNFSEDLKTRHPWFKTDLALCQFEDHYENSVATQVLATNIPISDRGDVQADNTVKYVDSSLPNLSKLHEYRVVVLFSNSWSMNSQLLKTRWANCKANVIKKGSDVVCCYICEPSKMAENTPIADGNGSAVITIDVDLEDDLEDAVTKAHRRHLESFFDCDFVGGISMQFNSMTFLSTETIRGIQSFLKQLNDPNDEVEAFTSSRNVRYISDGWPLQKALKASLNLLRI